MVNSIGNNHTQTQEASKLKPHAPHIQNNESRTQQNVAAKRKKTPKPSSAPENRVTTQKNKQVTGAKAGAASGSGRAYESGANTRTPVKPPYSETAQNKSVTSLIDILA